MRPTTLLQGLFLLVVLLASLQSQALDIERPVRPGHGLFRGNEHSLRPIGVGVGRANFGGNGCPQGTMRVVFAPDNLSFTMLFDKFIAQVDGKTVPGRDLRMCDSLIPVTIPENMQMEITRVDYRGFIGLPAQARAHLHSILNFRAPGGDRDRINFNYDFQGPVLDNYEISSDAPSDNAQPSQTEVSPCGGNTQLRVITSLQLASVAKDQNASITVDSIDGAAHAIYYINWRACSNSRPGNPDGRDHEGPHHGH